MSTETKPDPPTSAQSFVPLEANPPLLTTLSQSLGLSPALAFHDVLGLHDPDLLAFVPRPALALLLVFPLTDAYESNRLAEDAKLEDYTGTGEGEPVVWIKQTIRNACGLMGVLHGVLNGASRGFLEENSVLKTLLDKATPLPPAQRSQLLEQTPALATAHAAAAAAGVSATPAAEDDLDLHFVCFVKSEVDGQLWELDGRRKGPLARGQLGPEEDVLSPRAVALGPGRFLEQGGADLRFSCVALAASMD